MAKNMSPQATRLSQATLTRERTNMAKRPMAANPPCLRAAEYGDSPAAMASTLEAERTIMMPIAVRARVEPRIR
ncbi:hypothetical protein SRABI26_00738 [Arthrobacter sp. Bi26]|nr:hypothetical protein SRABI26_00738 [Arthrobacter sp. Bi26]